MTVFKGRYQAPGVSYFWDSGWCLHLEVQVVSYVRSNLQPIHGRECQKPSFGLRPNSRSSQFIKSPRFGELIGIYQKFAYVGE